MKMQCPPTNSELHPPTGRPDEGVSGQLHPAHGETAVCFECGAVHREGRWQWMPIPVGAKPLRCPACQCSQDVRAAGLVAIEGEFAAAHRGDIQRLIENLAALQKSAHPLQRILSMEERSDGFRISTTDAHLARAIGERLREVYRGNLDFHYNEADYMLRVRWQPWR